MIWGKALNILSGLLAMSVMLSACAAPPPSTETDTTTMVQTQVFADGLDTVKTGFITEQILAGADGDIHYSYYLPEGYDETRSYPLMMTMPGYGMMWFGEQSSGSNLDWTGFRSWTELDEDMIVASAQLTDWGNKSARQAIELTEYFIRNFAVDENRVYAAGYSAGGETMSRAVSMRPDLYAAYLHGASQWDGSFEPVAENRVAVYIFMAENDEYYGSQKARDAYDGLYAAYRETGLSDKDIGQFLQVEIPDNAYFNALGIYNYHGGGNVLFDDERILNWILSAQRPEGDTSENTGFSDVAENAWYAKAVEYVREKGLMNGTSANTFSPEAGTSRAMLAVILYRAAGSPAAGVSGFSDIPDGSWYMDAAAWADENGIMTGYGNGTFGGDDLVTREQIVTFLWRTAGSPAVGSSKHFSDENVIAAYALNAVEWARATGIVNGKSGNRFDPKGNATRAEVATILRNYMETQ